MTAIYPDLKTKTGLITGGASGIGEVMVRAFATQSAREGFLDLDANTGTAVCNELRRDGAEVHFEQVDVFHPDQECRTRRPSFCAGLRRWRLGLIF